MCQENNSGNVGICHCAKKLATTIKAVINAVLDSNIKNDDYGTHEIFLGNRYYFTGIFAILFEYMNLIGGGNCRNNRIYFRGNCERLTFPKGAERGTYRRLYSMLFRILATRGKDSKTLQFISRLRETGIPEVSRRRGWDIQQVV